MLVRTTFHSTDCGGTECIGGGRTDNEVLPSASTTLRDAASEGKDTLRCLQGIARRSGFRSVDFEMSVTYTVRRICHN